MGFLERWNKPRELDRFRSEVEDLLGKREIRYGSFERSMSLPEGIKAEDLKATYRDGVLTDLPGVDAKNVDIKVVGDVLTIKGSREEKRETKKADFLLSSAPPCPGRPYPRK